MSKASEGLPAPRYDEIATVAVPKREGRAETSIGVDFNVPDLFDQTAADDHRGLMLIGAGRRVRFMNPSSRAMLHFEGALPQAVASVIRDPEFGFAVGDCLHDRQPGWYELFLPEPDRLLRFHLIPVVDAIGAPVLVSASVEDITRLRHLETVRRDFVANVSHELRTPIASINLLVETLQRGAMHDPDAADHFLRRIEVETQAMARLVEELLELSRLESGILHLAIEPVSSFQLIEDVTSRLRPTADEKQVSIVIDVARDLPLFRADPKRLEQVVMNLVHNAIKFTPADGTVTVRAFRQGRGIQFDVIDTGVGMDSAEAARIFERFYKVDKGRNRAGGAGLGLAIARHLLELHGSQLNVVSEPGRGSRFSFALPVVIQDSLPSGR